MKNLLILFLLIPLLVSADFDHLFPGEEDPSVCHSVSVITGHLSLSFQDACVEGAEALTLQRSYSSSGALEREPTDSDLRMQLRRHGWILMGGWSFFSYTNLIIEAGSKHEKFKAYLSEKGGGMVCYSFNRRKGKSKYGFILKPTQSTPRASGHLSAQTNPKNNALLFNVKGSRQTVGTPDGGYKVFEGAILDDIDGEQRMKIAHFYRLVEEVLPSGHKIDYLYNCHTDLVRMEMRNPKKTKVYASIDFEPVRRAGGPFTIVAKTSDGKEISYTTYSYDRRHYISQVSSNFQPEELSTYTLGRAGIGARIEYIKLAGRNFLKVTYDMATDKVISIESPTGSAGQMSTVARFTYSPGLTEVLDEEGIRTRYYHDSEKLLKIDYLNKNGHLHSSQKFYWKENLLCTKALLDANQKPLFAKTFSYDEIGNVLKEVLWGNLTGNASPLEISDQGITSGGESYKKSYSYVPGFNVVQEEREEEGLTYQYFYKPDTNLLVTKLTCHQGNILRRQFYNYDEDNLLVAEINDDGCTRDQSNLVGVTERHEKYYDLDPLSGLPHTISEFSLGNILVKRTKLTYSARKQIMEEAVYDANDQYRYTLYTSYNSYGQVVRKTTPLGAENIYLYDELGQLKEVKEVGSAKKEYSYDAAGHQISVKIGDKISHTSYDSKGRVIAEIDSKGNVIEKSYDDFSNCLKMSLPNTGADSASFVSFTYDIQGNLTSTTMPLGEKTLNTYNAWRKPTHIIQADGTEIRHFYNKNGTLNKTVEPDGNVLRYSYDALGHMIAKEGDCASEFWTYSPFQMLSYKDTRGLETRYSYDGGGRQILVKAEERTTSFSYDALGFLEKTCTGDVSHTELHDVGGFVIEEWDNDDYENHMYSYYDNEGRKVKAVRITEQGEATDLFSYDEENQLISHTDPDKFVTTFLYDESEKNDLGQRVLKKTTVDPLGNSKCEIHDAADRIVCTVKRSPQSEIVFREDLEYDLSGNRIKRRSTVYQNNNVIKIITSSWSYDARGRVVQETENDAKHTFYSYDNCGRLSTKTLPSGIVLEHSYDHAGRLTCLRSSDDSINNKYFYERGPDFVKVIDSAQRSVCRSYNLFGEIITEISSRISLAWDYDYLGRPLSMTLPDGTRTRYCYKNAHMAAVERDSYRHIYTKFDVNGHVKEELSIYGNMTLTEYDLFERPLHQISPFCSQSLVYGPSGLVMALENSLLGSKSYAYDALNQMTKEGEETYLFDSLGNSSDHITNNYNQVIKVSDLEIFYDANGNPIERRLGKESVYYSYDALDRLIEITYPLYRRISYSYDPLSRLYSKEVFSYQAGTFQKESTQYYVYDQDKEIGIINEQNKFLELKILGLGLKGEIGAAIAIEINGIICEPLHDFRGNIIALIDKNAAILESYDISAFGQEKLSSEPLNPWRFCSKRFDEGLIFFGKRFFDPSLRRWLTPDPAGFIDGANLYAYVQNNPFNRLDLFGLWGEDIRPGDRILLNMAQIPRKREYKEFDWKGTMGGLDADGFASGDQWYKLQFTPEEHSSGWVNLLDHFKDFCPQERPGIALTTYCNGLGNTFSHFRKSCQTISGLLDGNMFIGLHSPTEGLVKDVQRNSLEQRGVMTPTVLKTRQFLAATSEQLYKANKNASMMHVCHSNGGVASKRALEGLCPDHKSIVMKNLLVYAVAPSEPISNKHAFNVMNVYSRKDFITKRYARAFIHNSDYDIRFLNCISNSPERTMHLADHDFLGPTYKRALSKYIEDLDSIGVRDVFNAH